MNSFKLSKKSNKSSYSTIGWVLIFIQLISFSGSDFASYKLPEDIGTLIGSLTFGILGILFIIKGNKEKKKGKEKK